MKGVLLFKAFLLLLHQEKRRLDHPPQVPECLASQLPRFGIFGALGHKGHVAGDTGVCWRSPNNIHVRPLSMI